MKNVVETKRHVVITVAIYKNVTKIGKMILFIALSIIEINGVLVYLNILKNMDFESGVFRNASN